MPGAADEAAAVIAACVDRSKERRVRRGRRGRFMDYNHSHPAVGGL
jgi:hypothetical protein